MNGIDRMKYKCSRKLLSARGKNTTGRDVTTTTTTATATARKKTLFEMNLKEMFEAKDDSSSLDICLN